MVKIFVSHSRRDSAIAEKIAHAVRAVRTKPPVTTILDQNVNPGAIFARRSKRTFGFRTPCWSWLPRRTRWRIVGWATRSERLKPYASLSSSQRPIDIHCRSFQKIFGPSQSWFLIRTTQRTPQKKLSDDWNRFMPIRRALVLRP